MDTTEQELIVEMLGLLQKVAEVSQRQIEAHRRKSKLIKNGEFWHMLDTLADYSRALFHKVQRNGLDWPGLARLTGSWDVMEDPGRFYPKGNAVETRLLDQVETRLQQIRELQIL